MKRYFNSFTIVLLSMLAFTACTEEEGQAPGSDSKPYINLYQYAADASAGYDGDTDTHIRVAANNVVADIYYLVQKTADFQKDMSNEALADYIVNNGTKAEIISDAQSGGKMADFTLTSLKDDYTIAVVGVSGGQKTKAYTTNFVGQNWISVAKGNYIFNANKNVAAFAAKYYEKEEATVPTELQYLETDKTLYRLKNLYATGRHLQIKLYPEYKAEDEDGEYTFFRVPTQSTPIEYSSYGPMSVRDIGYWQGDDAFVFSAGYESGMYTDYSCFFFVQYFVSAGSCGYGYDYFIPTE
jgi:hypothetical protein